MSTDAGLASASGGERTASLLEAAGEESARGGGGSAIGGGSDDGTYGGGRGGTGGRRGRGRGGRDRFVAGSSNGHGGGGSGCGDAEPASGSGAGGGAAGDGTLGFKHDFVQMGPIGEGGFSVVWKVRARRTGRLYAIKRSKREFRGRRDRDRCLWEARALKRLAEHPGVLRFERAWQEEGHFCLQTELCELGTLKDFLERVRATDEWGTREGVGGRRHFFIAIPLLLLLLLCCFIQTAVVLDNFDMCMYDIASQGTGFGRDGRFACVGTDGPFC